METTLAPDNTSENQGKGSEGFKPFQDIVHLPPDHYEAYADYASHLAILFLVLFIIFWIFLLVLLLLDKEHRRSPLHLVTANAVLGHLLASLLIHTGSIRLEFMYKPVTTAYCWLWHHGFYAYLFFVPYSLIVYFVERLMYIVRPTEHKARLNKFILAGMLLAPWVIGVIFCIGMVDGYPNNKVKTQVDGTREWDKNSTSHVCDLINTWHADDRDAFAGVVCTLPTICMLMIAITALIIWCCYKENLKMGTNFMMMGEHVHITVRDSVIGMALLAFVGMPFIIANIFRLASLPLDGMLLSVFGVFEGVVWIGTIKEVRQKCIYLCKTCCGLKPSGAQGAVHYNTEDAEDVAIEQ